jgi:hypothetical protein
MTTTQQVKALIGQPVELGLRGGFGGITLRWGVIREIRPASLDDDAILIVDDYHDSAGLGTYLPGRGCNVTEGVPVTLSGVVTLRRKR